MGKAIDSMLKLIESPLVLDLDGDGVETTSLAAGTRFDHNRDGVAERTAWVGSDDGLLVLDRNGNGVIDNGGELFGNNTVSEYGSFANGFAALAELDSVKDGVIDSQDQAFAALRVWRDANGDGVSSAEELLSLVDAGVQSISLDYVNADTVDSNQNEHRQQGSYTRSDGSSAAINDVWFVAQALVQSMAGVAPAATAASFMADEPEAVSPLVVCPL